MGRQNRTWPAFVLRTRQNSRLCDISYCRVLLSLEVLTTLWRLPVLWMRGAKEQGRELEAPVQPLLSGPRACVCYHRAPETLPQVAVPTLRLRSLRRPAPCVKQLLFLRANRTRTGFTANCKSGRVCSWSVSEAFRWNKTCEKKNHYYFLPTVLY